MIRVADIQAAVAREHGITLDAMREPGNMPGSRSRSHARHVAMFFSRELTRHSTVRIGQLFGGRDHSTVIHGCRAVEQRWRADPELRAKMQRVFAELVRGDSQ